MKISLHGEKRYIGIILIICILIGAYYFLNREEHSKEMNDYNRRELAILNSLIKKTIL